LFFRSDEYSLQGSRVAATVDHPRRVALNPEREKDEKGWAAEMGQSAVKAFLQAVIKSDLFALNVFPSYWQNALLLVSRRMAILAGSPLLLPFNYVNQSLPRLLPAPMPFSGSTESRGDPARPLAKMMNNAPAKPISDLRIEQWRIRRPRFPSSKTSSAAAGDDIFLQNAFFARGVSPSTTGATRSLIHESGRF